MNGYLQDMQLWTPQLLAGLKITLVCSISSMSLAMVLGLLIATVRVAEGGPLLRAFQLLLRVYVETLRGLPLIVTLFIVYFGLPAVGVTITNDPIMAGILGLTLALGAYLSEVFRAAIQAIDPGQTEAALSFGMSRRITYQHIVLPQAFVVAIPTLGGYFIGLLKDTALLSFISVSELLHTGVEIVSATFKAFEVYFTVGAIYLVLSIVAAWAVAIVEARLRGLQTAFAGMRVGDLGSTVPDFVEEEHPPVGGSRLS